MFDRKLRVGAVLVLALLAAGCGEPREVVTLHLQDALVTHTGEGRDVTVLLVRKAGSWVGGFATARRWNAASHPVRADKLEWTDRGIEGTLEIALLPDSWIPRDHKPRRLVVTVRAGVDGNEINGAYTGRFGERPVVGEVRGNTGPEDTPGQGDRAGLLRTFIPTDEGGLKEVVMRFTARNGEVVALHSAALEADELALVANESGLTGTAVLVTADNDRLPVTFALFFVGRDIGGSLRFGGNGEGVIAPASGTLERVADTILGNRTEGVDPLSEQRMVRIRDAQEKTSQIDDSVFIKGVHRQGGSHLPYRYYRPQAASAENPLPLVVFLHGAGQRGADNEKQLTTWPKVFVLPEHQQKRPCHVLVPHASNWYGQRQQGADANAPTIGEMIAEVTEKLAADESVDASRVYLTGLSMGGFGTCMLLADRPTLFAAGVPICGASPERAKDVGGTPVWVFHGDCDVTVHPGRSREFVRSLQGLGHQPRYTEYHLVGHGSYKWAYTYEPMFEWLFAQRRGGQ